MLYHSGHLGGVGGGEGRGQATKANSNTFLRCAAGVITAHCAGQQSGSRFLNETRLWWRSSRGRRQGWQWAGRGSVTATPRCFPTFPPSTWTWNTPAEPAHIQNGGGGGGEGGGGWVTEFPTLSMQGSACPPVLKCNWSKGATPQKNRHAAILLFSSWFKKNMFEGQKKFSQVLPFYA